MYPIFPDSPPYRERCGGAGGPGSARLLPKIGAIARNRLLQPPLAGPGTALDAPLASATARADVPM
jgi:hypothetical protein